MLNRTFCEGDNLEFLLRMPDESVDLIATDPPFNKNKEFQGIGKAEGANFKDYWSWEDDVHKPYLDHLRKHWPALTEVIEAAYAAHSPGMAAFLAFMAVRLIEMHRILKPTGSFYLHCDPTANAYLRLMLDSVFGREQHRNEVVWCYKGMPSKASRFQQKHDSILFYGKTDAAHFNVLTTEPDPGSLKTFETGRRVGYNANHKKKMVTVFDWDKYEQAVAAGKIPADLAPTEFKGGAPPMRDWWDDIKILGGPKNKERYGWPTQKPLALYRRIIEASSNKGDLVLDPFAGCATTCVAAEQLERQWIGIDLSPKARGITLDRLTKEAGAGTFWPNEVHTVTAQDLLPLPEAIEHYLSIPALPERQQRGGAPKQGYKAEDVRRYLAAREAVGTSQIINLACQGCGYMPPFDDYQEVDHIVPREQGGKNVWDNLCLLCGPCNRRKAHKLTTDELRAEIKAAGRLLDESKLVDMDAKSIAKRDRALRPLQ